MHAKRKEADHTRWGDGASYSTSPNALGIPRPRSGNPSLPTAATSQHVAPNHLRRRPMSGCPTHPSQHGYHMSASRTATAPLPAYVSQMMTHGTGHAEETRSLTALAAVAPLATYSNGINAASRAPPGPVSPAEFVELVTMKRQRDAQRHLPPSTSTDKLLRACYPASAGAPSCTSRSSLHPCSATSSTSAAHAHGFRGRMMEGAGRGNNGTQRGSGGAAMAAEPSARPASAAASYSSVAAATAAANAAGANAAATATDGSSREGESAPSAAMLGHSSSTSQAPMARYTSTIAQRRSEVRLRTRP